jgi:hypothetical protein
MSDNFYVSPVELETVDGDVFLGVRFITKPAGLQTRVVVHGYTELKAHGVFPAAHRWRYRSPRAAGTEQLRLAGFSARLHAALRFSYPAAQARQAASELLSVFLALGHSPKTLRETFRRVAGKYPAIFQPTQAVRLMTRFRALRRGLRTA